MQLIITRPAQAPNGFVQGTHNVTKQVGEELKALVKTLNQGQSVTYLQFDTVDGKFIHVDLSSDVFSLEFVPTPEDNQPSDTYNIQSARPRDY